MRRFLWPLVILAPLLLLQLIRQHPLGDNTIQYRDQKFNLAKRYRTYDAYKDDPDNLATNELDRIEKTMIEAQLPSSWKNREELFHTLIFEIKFPAYGMGGLGEEAQTDDGTGLLVESIEIPQREKNRYIVVQEFAGRVKLMDDFVASTATNALRHVALQGGKLYYRDANGLLIREKQL